MTSQAPILMKILPFACGKQSTKRDVWYRFMILVFTFFCYTSYHLSRKPISVVKSVLHHKNCTKVHHHHPNTSDPYWCDWGPFNKSNYNDLLGTLDLAYLISYAAAMFLSGHIADRMNLRYYLSSGMIASGAMTIAFGLGYFFDIHAYYFYIIIQVVGGAFQATGWPAVVACVGNWFGKGKRGLIMGIWNAHTSVGNILGSVIAGVFVDSAWGWSFVVPGIIISVLGVLVFLFLVPHPKDVNCVTPDHSDGTTVVKSLVFDTEADTEEERMFRAGESTLLLPNKKHQSHNREEKAISICKAICIPGVVEYSLCLFFAKLVSYTFLFWLPKYLSEETSLSAEESAYTSTFFDAGGILGGIMAGYLSDRFRMRAVVCVSFLVFASPMLIIYQLYGSDVPYGATCSLLALVGVFVNGPYALITTAVSADLGTHKTVRNSAKALGMVTAIIDGTGSIGAAVGPLLTGVLSSTGWRNVFYMLIGSNCAAVILLSRPFVRDIYRRVKHIEDDVTIIVPKGVNATNR